MQATALTTIQLREETRERLKSRKRGGESYDATLSRILDNTSPGVGFDD